ncbi:MAG TPA: hypothetical protein VNN10_04760 [Dehalococcoidia bacterium]|nr:hypothetical protein [Dehalococcoidia bacterium]
MTIPIKLAYAAAVAALLVLLVAFGTRAIAAAPQPPQYPTPPIGRPPVVPPPATTGPQAPPAIVTPVPDELVRYEQEQRDFQRAVERYEDRRREYRRNVFLASAAVAIAAIAGGAALWASFDALSLGFIAGGFATLLYGVLQAGSDLDEISPALIFVVALAGFALVLGAGYRWLASSPPKR